MYFIKEEIFENEEIGKYITYGVVIYQKDKAVREIYDVSTSKRKVMELCARCNRLKLDPMHIDDVIEDFL